MDYKYLTRAFTLLTLFTLISPAFAYVKYLDIDDDGKTTPTIEVFQTEDENGDLKYTTLKGGNIIDPTINIGVEIEAKCKSGYELSRTLLINNDVGNDIQGRYDYFGLGSTEPSYTPVVSEPIIEQDIDFTDGNQTFGKRVEYLRLPLDSFEPLIDFGNQWVNDHPSYNIRYSDWTAFLEQPVGFAVRCKRRVFYTGIDKWWGYSTFWKPIRVVYRGASAEFDLNNLAPGQGSYFDPSLPNGQLGDIVNVDANLLIVTNDQANDCKLNLSASFTTNGETVIFYHLVDDRDVMSPLYKVAVDQTYTAFVNHVVDLSEREPEGPVPSEDLGFSAIPTDRLQGFYQIEVVSPYKTNSNIADYNIEPCRTRPDTIDAIVGTYDECSRQ
ncbi:MAG: hypothetical protein PVG72_04315 [Gammaproteobacteria bacterium]|jgi:hypothetical protein